jgi:MoaA/NifB/PqqE/SkfB family radical SAM enzyme
MRAFNEIGIELNNICNYRCKHCLRDFSKDAQNLPLALIRRVLQEAKAYAVKHVAFTGGEATLHPQLARILDATEELGYSFHLCTNGSTLPRLWNRLFEGRRNLTGISISLDGAREDTHDLVREPGSYRRVMQAISLCRVRNVPVTLQMILNRANRPEIAEMALLASQLGIEKLYYGFLQPVPEMDARNLILSPAEMLAVKDEVLRLRPSITLPIELSVGHYEENPLVLCRTLDLSTIYIDHRGNLNFCCQLSGYLEADDYDSEVVCSLHTHSLAEAHLRLLERVMQHHRDKLSRIHASDLTLVEQFPCFYCARYFHKVGWLDAQPDHLWNDGRPRVAAPAARPSELLELPVLSGRGRGDGDFAGG